MPRLLLRIDAVNFFLFGHLHVSFMALSEVVHLHTHTHTYAKELTALTALVNSFGACLQCNYNDMA